VLLVELPEELLTDELLLLLRVEVPLLLLVLLLLLTEEGLADLVLLLLLTFVELFWRVFELRTRTASLFLFCCRVFAFVELLTLEFLVLADRVLTASLDEFDLVDDGLVDGRELAKSRGVGL
jgi:hypothetical protein